MQGANAQRAPVPATSRAVTRAARSHEVGVARGAEADVVREEHRALDVAVAVDRVDAVDHRDAEPGRQRLALEAGRSSSAQVAGSIRRGSESPPDSTEPMKKSRTSPPSFERGLVGLGHLADLLVQRHLRQQRLDVGRRHAGLARRGDALPPDRRRRAGSRRPGPAPSRRRRPGTHGGWAAPSKSQDRLASVRPPAGARGSVQPQGLDRRSGVEGRLSPPPSPSSPPR